MAIAMMMCVDGAIPGPGEFDVSQNNMKGYSSRAGGQTIGCKQHPKAAR